MHGLPAEFDPNVFVGCDLESITFASNAIHLAFGADRSITVLRHVRYRDGGVDLRDDVLPVTHSDLPALVGLSVVRAEVRSPGDLILEFEGGGAVIVEDDSPHYESYSVRTPAGEVFV